MSSADSTSKAARHSPRSCASPGRREDEAGSLMMLRDRAASLDHDALPFEIDGCRSR